MYAPRCIQFNTKKPMYQRMFYYIPEMPGFMPLIKADELVCMYKSDTAFQKGGRGGGGALIGSF